MKATGMSFAIVALLATGTATHARTLEFSGHSWNVRAAGSGGPGPNDWDPDNVWVDDGGALHLKLTKRDGQWYAAEVSTRERLGFGRYEFQITGPLDRLDPHVVFGLFNYPTRDVGPDATHEIDIEFAQWGNAQGPIGNYTVWPTTTASRRQSRSFPFRLKGEESTQSFTWTPTKVTFQSREGPKGEGSQTLQNWSFEPDNPTASIAQKPMPIHINLWCFQGRPPTNGQEVELVVRGFKFTPLPVR